MSLKHRNPGESFNGSLDDPDTMFSLSPVIKVSVCYLYVHTLACTHAHTHAHTHTHTHTLTCTRTHTLQEGDTILVESYARIKHLQTGTWLHLDKGDPPPPHTHTHTHLHLFARKQSIHGVEFTYQWTV